MRKLTLLSATLLAVLLTLQHGRLYANSCSCTWQVRQLTSTDSSGDCPIATLNAQRNAGFWASTVCGATACSVVWTDLGCTTDSSGAATDTSLINFQCC